MNRFAPLFFFLGAIFGYLSHDTFAAFLKLQPWRFVPLLFLIAGAAFLFGMAWRDAGRTS